MLFLKSILEEIAVSLKDTSAETSLANMSPEKQKQLSTLVATLYAASPSEPSSKGKAPASFGRG